MSNPTSKAALLDRFGNVIGEVFGAPAKGNTIQVAGAHTAAGDPVNVDTLKISRSKENLELAKMEPAVFLDSASGTYCFY